MTDTSHIQQENGPDRLLAIAYGELLDGKRSVDEIDDPLFKMLNFAKKEQDQFESSIRISGNSDVWQRLLSDMEGVPSDASSKRIGRTRIFKLNTGSVWFRAAAAVLLITLTSLVTFMLTRPAGPALVASADSVIRTIELRDGSAVTLRPNSSLFEITYTDNRQLYRLEGEALFDVQSNASREFRVQAGEGEVVVLGTRFNLYGRGENSRVDLFEGTVRFRNSMTLEELTLQPGEAAEITGISSLSGVLSTNSDEVTGWVRNRLTFRDRQLSEIIKELEFHFGIRITAPDSVLNEALGGSVSLNNAEQTLRDLGMVLGGEFREIEPGQFEFRQD